RPFRFQQRLIDEQQDQLSHYESAAGQCVGELQKNQDQVHSLQDQVRESEARNQKLQLRLGEMELELRSTREEAQRKERNIQNISDNFSSKEAETADLYLVIEEQKKMLSSLKDLTNHQQLRASGGDSARAQQQASRTQEDLTRALQRLETDLQGALQHRRDAEQHNQELQSVLDKARSALQEREEQLREGEQERESEKEEREKTITQLTTSLQTKDQLLEEYWELLDDQSNQKRDAQLHKLRQRVRERDRALERAVDERFLCVEEKEEESRRLRLLLREKERDLERQRCVLDNNEETITSLELLLRGKAVELQQVVDAWRNVQRQRQQSEEMQSWSLRERDAIIEQLQGALLARTQEAQDLRCSLLAQVHSAPCDVLEELKLRLQLKDRLFQEVLSDRTRQAQEHQDQVQGLLTSIGSRDQYIQDSALQLGDVMTEQTSRLQELRRQLSSGSGWRSDSGPDSALELQAVQEELGLALRREKENQELSRSQTERLEALSRTLLVKEELIRDLQRQMVEPSDLQLVERLTQEVQELRESLVQPDGGEPSSDDEDDDVNSEEEESVDEEESELRLQSLSTKLCAGPVKEGQGLMEVKQLVEQKRAVERELTELKAQLEKSGFSSLSHMRKALLSLQAQNQDLNHRLQADGPHHLEEEEEEEEELDVTIGEEEEEEEEEEEGSETWEAWDSDLSLSHTDVQTRDEARTGGASRSKRPHQLSSVSQAGLRPSMHLGGAAAPERTEQTLLLQQRSKELRERLMVSEATVQAQAEQLKDFRELLTETAVQQDSKQIQVDLQDLGYETCGRSENEAEREDTSSPEFDDLEISSSTFTKTTTQTPGSDEASSLQRLVEDLRSQLCRSQAVIRGLQHRLRSLSTSGDDPPTTPRKVNWCFQASPSHSGTEEDEGWQSSDGGALASPRQPHPDKGLQQLESRVDALENQLKKGGKTSIEQDGKSATWPGKFDSLIQTQARELSHLRQRQREGRGLCSILTQHLGDTTKAFEELLRANDIDYYQGQSFREQLAQSSALAQRVGAKISGRDQPEDPDEKTELLAIRLSKELQQKDKIIESLRSKLNQHLHHHHHHHSHRSDTPGSSHALSDASDQSDRISYVSDEHGSTNGDLGLCSDVDAASELGQEDTSSRVLTDRHSHSSTVSRHPSVPPSIASSHRTQSCLSCPSMHCPSSPHRAVDMQSQTGFSTPQSKPLQGFPFAHQPPDASGFLPLSLHGYQPSPFSSSLDAGLAMRAGASLLESSALWDTTYGTRPARLGADLSSGSSGYQSGTSHTGAELMKEHLREVRSLRQRLEDSIHTNDRLRQQLEDRLARVSTEKGAPTNIYIQGLDSVGQLSSEIRLLKEENISLQNQLKQNTADGCKEADQLREAKLQAEAEAHDRENTQLREERERRQETINRLQQQVDVLQQQLRDGHSLVQTLQSELQLRRRGGGVTTNTHSGQVGDSLTFDPRELHVQLEQQLSGQPGARRLLFTDNVLSPPVRDTGLVGPSSPLHAGQTRAETLEITPPRPRRPRHRTVPSPAVMAAMPMEAALRSLLVPALQDFSPRQPSDSGSVRKLLSDSRTLRQVLEEADALLHMFWRAALPNPEEPKQDQSLKDEVVSLRLKLSEQEQALKDAMERVKSSNRTKDNMETLIISQMSRTRDVLRKAKTNLQVKTHEASGSSPSLLVAVS
ncbi:unnamed protein product, partial [Pleuronectes platessa]